MQALRPALRCPVFGGQPNAACTLPDCFCSRSGREPPSGIPLNQLPQIIVLTFDDPVNGNNFNFYTINQRLRVVF